MRILLAVDVDVEATVLATIIEHGHDIVDRVTGAATLSESVGRLCPDVVVVQAVPETLTPESLSACDRAGARTIALITDSVERQYAVSLGILERVDARDGWGAVERLLARSVLDHHGPGQSAQGQSAQGQSAQGQFTPGQHPPEQPGFVQQPARGPEWRGQSSDAAMHRGATPHMPGVPSGVPSGLSNSGEDGRSRSITSSIDNRASSERSKRRARRASRPNERPTRWAHARRSNVSAAPVEAAAARPLHTGRMLAVWGPHGAPGRTTCAITLATEFARNGARTVLVDADSYGGAIGQLLAIADEAPGIAAACRLAVAGALTVDELNRLAQPVRTGDLPLRVLTGISNPARWPELGRERMIGVLEQLRHWADIVVVDVGFNLEHDEELVSDISAPRRNAATHVVLERADLVVAIGEATPVGLQRLLRGRMALTDIVAAPERVRVVANRVRKGMHGVDTAAQVAEVLRRFGGVDDAVMLPDDPKACDRAITEAAALTQVSARSQLARAYVSFATNLLAELQRSAVTVA